MKSVDQQFDAYLATFFASWPFNHLSLNLQKKAREKLRLCSFQVGQLIHLPGELPSMVHCVVQERVRILGPIAHQSPTLAVLGEGTVLGWDSLIRRTTTGSVRATIASPHSEREILTIALSADDFEALMIHHLMEVLRQRVSLLELFDILSRFLATYPMPASEINLKEIVQYIEREQLAVVQHWFPQLADQSSDQSSSSHRLERSPINLSSDHLWLISGGEFLNRPIGSPITSVDQLKPLRPSRFPVRLVGINRNFMRSVLSFSDASFSDSSLSANSLISTGSQSACSNPQLPLETSKPGGPQASGSDPSEMQSLEPESLMSYLGTADSAETSVEVLPAGKNYPIWRSPFPDPLEDLIACLGMMCDRLQVPYRPDSLRHWFAKQSFQQFDQQEWCVRIAQAVGLNAQVVHFTPSEGGIRRLKVPAILQCRGVLTVLHDVHSTTAVIGSPRTGLLQIPLQKLTSYLVADPNAMAQALPGCQAIVLERFEKTPTKRFGLQWFFPIVAAQRGILLQVLLASMVIQILGVANPLLVQQIIDNVIISGNQSAMSMFGLLMILFALLEGGLTVLRRYLLASTTNRIDLHLGIEIIRHLVHLPLSFFEQRPVGELSARLSELENIRSFLTDTAITVVLDVLFSVIYIAVMCLYSLKLTACVLLTVPIIVVSTLIISNIQQKLLRITADQGAKVQSYLIETLNGVSTVKAQNMESLVEANWRDRYVQFLTSSFTTSTISTSFYSFNQFLNTVSSLLVLWVGAELVLEAKLTLGGLIAFRILTGYVTGPLLRLAGLWQRFQETALSIDLLADIADSPLEEPIHQHTRMKMPLIQGRVQYAGVNFGFKPGQLQLVNVNLEISSGTFVGIVGQSGSGKSTLMKLLPRLYSPETGRITVDGYDVSKLDLKSLRSQIGIVSQDAVLFQGSIRDNIALFGDLADDEVIEAAQVADAHDFIMQLPEGYSTQVGERGAALSGGQRQRIAIARVVARNPRLLIFDEATSALDYETEWRVCHNLMQRFQDRTCFFITHRLNTVAAAHHILLMQSGMIAEQGTHEELMSLRQLYYCLFNQQSRQLS